MPMLVANDPVELRAIAVDTFIHCNHGSHESDEIGAIALYIVTPADVLRRRFHERMHPWGWRYVRTAAQGMAAFCDISLSKPHRISHAFAATADRLLSHALSAEESLLKHRRTFEGRVLSIPAIQMEALWAHTPEPRIPDRFYGLPPGQPVWPDRGFIKEARRRANLMLQPHFALSASKSA